jgi:hypothetical protein
MTTTTTPTDEPVRTRTRTMRVPRSRGAVSGLLLILLGAWGALIPFIGPSVDYSWGTDQSWHWTNARLWLEVLPGAATALGGLLLMISANRIRASLGGWLAALAGAWFVVGLTLAPLLHLGQIGQPLSQTDRGRAAAQLGYFYGLGAVILFLAAFALGRLAVVGLRDLRAAERDERLAAEQARAEQELAERQALRNREAERSRTQPHEDRVAGERISDDELRPGPSHTADATLPAADRTARYETDDSTGRTARYEPDRPYGSQSQSDQPTTRYDSDVIGSDYGSTGRPGAHEAAPEEGR